MAAWWRYGLSWCIETEMYNDDYNNNVDADDNNDNDDCDNNDNDDNDNKDEMIILLLMILLLMMMWTYGCMVTLWIIMVHWNENA